MLANDYRRVPDQDTVIDIPRSPPPTWESQFADENQRMLESSFGPQSDSDSDDDDDRQNEIEAARRQAIVSATAVQPLGTANPNQPASRPSHVAQSWLPFSFPSLDRFRFGRRPAGSGPAGAHDGVFSNLQADPAAEQAKDEEPPTYEQAAADAAPPYQTHHLILTSGLSDEMPAGSFFSFMWNAVISVSFQLVGFFLTYLLHTSHAGRCGSRAGLGITLIQYGLAARDPAAFDDDGFTDPSGFSAPENANNHKFDPSKIEDRIGSPAASAGPSEDSGGMTFLGVPPNYVFSYTLIFAGAFMAIHSTVDFFRARRKERERDEQDRQPASTTSDTP